MTSSLRTFRVDLEQAKGQLKQINQDIETTKKRITELESSLSDSEQAQVIMQRVAQETQSAIQVHISEMVSSSLDIFDDPYVFNVEIKPQRGKTECVFTFEKDGENMHPLASTGGGPIDMATFALRPSLMTLALKKVRTTLLLDEPFKFLSRDLQPKAGLMLKELSQELGLQIIMISHSPDLIEGSDKVFEIIQRKGISEVKGER